MYIPLHGHSTFSFLEAIGKPKDIVLLAKELGLPSIAMTDYTGMYGVPSFYQTAKDEGINPIIGIEVGFVMSIQSSQSTKNIGNICFLAKDTKGYHNLVELTSFANQEGLPQKPKIDISILAQHTESIIAFMGGTESRIEKMRTNGEGEEKIEEILNEIKKLLGEENVYLEITVQDEKLIPEIAKTNQHILSLAKKTQTKCIINNNYFYPKQKQKQIREMALAIKDNLKMYDEQRRKPKGQYHIMTEEEIKTICLENGYSKEQINERLQTNESIANQISIKIEMGQALFPKYDTPPEIIQLYETNKHRLIIDE